MLKYTIGDHEESITVSSVTGSGPWTINMSGSPDLSDIRVNDCFTDNNSDEWLITAVDDVGDSVTVSDQEGNGGTPATGTGTVGEWYADFASYETGLGSTKRDMVTNTESLDVRFCNDWPSGYGNGDVYTGIETRINPTQTDWDANTTYNQTLSVIEGEEHDFTVDGSGFFWKSTANVATGGIISPFQKSFDYGVIEWQKIDMELSNFYMTAIRNYASGSGNNCNYTHIRNNLIFADDNDDIERATNGLIKIQQQVGAGKGCHVYNNTILGGTDAGYSLGPVGIRAHDGYPTSITKCFIYNNTVLKMEFCLHRSALGTGGSSLDDIHMVVNNYFGDAYGSTIKFDGGMSPSNADANFNHNTTSDTDAGSSNGNISSVSVSSCDFNDTTVGQQDVRIASTSALVGDGEGPDNDSNVPSPDPDGTARTGASCDVGCFMAVATGGNALLFDHAVLRGANRGIGIGIN